MNNIPDVLNFATANFIGLQNDPAVNARAEDTMRNYGCGACGPRGFYGTTDVHMAAEESLATFSGTRTAILYSFGSATSSSTIPAFCKRGDLIVCDEMVNFSLQTGVALSRAEVVRFRHNDMAHLEEVLASVIDADKSNPGLAKTQRRLILVEGVYQNSGKVCPLDRVVALKEKYLFRVMVDESFSLGVLGRTGRGSLEAHAVPRELVDIATADLGNALAAVGGFCVGSDEVVKHQRLSGAGYCFSASQPPFLAAAATVALDIVADRGGELAVKLRENIAVFRGALDVDGLVKRGWYMDGDAVSPLMHVRCKDDAVGPEQFATVQKICLKEGVLFTRPVYAAGEVRMPRPSVRVTVSTVHSKEQLVRAAGVLQSALHSVL